MQQVDRPFPAELRRKTDLYVPQLLPLLSCTLATFFQSVRFSKLVWFCSTPPRLLLHRDLRLQSFCCHSALSHLSALDFSPTPLLLRSMLLSPLSQGLLVLAVHPEMTSPNGRYT